MIIAPNLSQLFLPPKQTIVPLPGRLTMVHQLPPPRLIWLDQTPSTHTLFKEDPEYIALPPYTMVAARRQTAGRGQRGNSWESEDFKNLTFSMNAATADVPPAAQFAVSEATALAVTALLQGYGINASVKWPNDIYVGDRKICGILIDHSLTGNKITRTIISAGLNINQTRFLSDAPNPISMLQAAGCIDSNPQSSHTPLSPILNHLHEYDLDEIAMRLNLLIREFVALAATADGRATLHNSFMQHLYRGDGEYYPFRDNLRHEDIRAAITDISPTGILTLRLPDSSTRSYAFKEISFI